MCIYKRKCIRYQYSSEEETAGAANKIEQREEAKKGRLLTDHKHLKIVSYNRITSEALLFIHGTK